MQHETAICYIHGFSGSGIRTECHRMPHLCPMVSEASAGRFKQLELEQLRLLQLLSLSLCVLTF